MKMTTEQIKKMRDTILEFFARFVMNTFKLIVGLALGVAVTSNGTTIHSSLLTSNGMIMTTLVVLAFAISLVETWQDWELVSKKPVTDDDQPADA